MKALVALEDGTVFEGKSFTGPGEAFGEIVFNTGMTGYQEILTDPSYFKQIITMTVPHVGNTGINREDIESAKIWVSGFVVRSLSPVVSNWRNVGDLDGYLKEQGKIGLSEVATRARRTALQSEAVLRNCGRPAARCPARVPLSAAASAGFPRESANWRATASCLLVCPSR